MKGEVVRLVGVGVTKLDDGSYQQLSLFDQGLTIPDEPTVISTGAPDRERQKKLDDMTEKLRLEFGKDIIKKGSSL